MNVQKTESEGVFWKYETLLWRMIYLKPAERQTGCSPRQMAVSDALLMMDGVLLQQVSQMSLSNLPTLERREAAECIL